MKESERIFRIIEEFEVKSIGIATDFSGSSYEEYEMARANIMSEPSLHLFVPDWIVRNRFGSDFRASMQIYSEHYQPRRKFIRDAIFELKQCFEKGASRPVFISFDEVESAIKSSSLENLWKKIHSRRESDPEGAITASKTLLESVLKNILEELSIGYGEKDDLPQLYKKVSQKLNLSPGGQEELIFKQILQGVSSIVIGFSSIRNKYGDAHGKGKKYIGPSKRHADLVVNLAGAMCVFLIEALKVSQKQ